jgi:hypothetical protein
MRKPPRTVIAEGPAIEVLAAAVDVGTRPYFYEYLQKANCVSVSRDSL